MKRRLIEIAVILAVLISPVLFMAWRIRSATREEPRPEYAPGQTLRNSARPWRMATVLRPAIEPDEWDVTNSLYFREGAWIIRREDTATTHAVSPDILDTYYTDAP